MKLNFDYYYIKLNKIESLAEKFIVSTPGNRWRLGELIDEFSYEPGTDLEWVPKLREKIIDLIFEQDEIGAIYEFYDLLRLLKYEYEEIKKAEFKI